MSEGDQRATIDRYATRYREHGYSPRTLGWDKGNQEVRFDVLTSGCDLRGLAVLDVGCGFGDLNLVLERKFGPTYQYTGVDLVPELIQKARQRWPGERHQFIVGDFLSLEFEHDHDYVIASGIFNHRFVSTNNRDFVIATMTRAFELCRVGLAMDFLSDKVDYRHEHTFHSAPEDVLEFAFGLTRNVALRNDYMPFEFSVFLRKDDSFDPDDPVFNAHKNARLVPRNDVASPEVPR